jgi:hypothetical protein
LPHRPTLQAASHPTVRLLQEAWPLISALSAHAVWRQCNVVMDALSEVRLGVPDGGSRAWPPVGLTGWPLLLSHQQRRWPSSRFGYAR